jgi:hypothetical protein
MRSLLPVSFSLAAALTAAVLVACSSDGDDGSPNPSGSGGAPSGGATSTGGGGAPSGGAPSGGATSGGSGATPSGGASGAAGAAGMGGVADCLGDEASMAPSDCTNLIYYAVDCGDGARPLGSEHCDYLKVHARRQIFEAVFACLSTLDIAIPFCAAEHASAVRDCEAAAFEQACDAAGTEACQEIGNDAACPNLTVETCNHSANSLSEATRQNVFDCYADMLPTQVDMSLTCEQKLEECFWNIGAYTN